MSLVTQRDCIHSLGVPYRRRCVYKEPDFKDEREIELSYNILKGEIEVVFPNKRWKKVVEGRKNELNDAILSEVDLSGADLSEANLSEANLFAANLLTADLSGADLSGANLSYANLDRAYFGYTNLKNAIFTGAEGLETANFEGAKNIPKEVKKIIEKRR